MPQNFGQDGETFTGSWTTTFGPMELVQQGDRVEGTYGPSLVCTIEGRIEQGRLQFQYREPMARGEGWFALKRTGRFEGQWRQEGQERWQPWIGERGFEGVWESSFGLLRLVHQGDQVLGHYEGMGPASIEGQITDGQLVLRYQEPTAAGEAHFTLADDAMSFEGQWLPDGGSMWQSWQGRRLLAPPGTIWLVVIEAHWQRHLLDMEYSFGKMLREFFARVPGVQFCHRFFNNEEGVRQWCRDLMYIPGPTIVVLASHGTAAGLAVHGQTISPHALTESLRWADNIQLLHFSACLTMNDGALVNEMRQHATYPVSGYTTSVDWAASAIAEFTYLDMILSKRLSPTDAAVQLPRLLSFAGDQGAPDAPYPATGFRMLVPE